MTSTSTAEPGTKKHIKRRRKKVGKKSAGQRRNAAISAEVSKADDKHGDEGAANEGFALPRLAFKMALETVARKEESLTTVVRDAAEAAGGDLLFVLPYTENSASDDDVDEDAGSEPGPVEHAMVRLVEDRKSRLFLVRAGDAGFDMVEENAIESGLVSFARASIDVLERIGSDERIVAPLTTLAKH